MTSPGEDEKRVIPGVEPVTEITVHTHMLYGAGLPDPLDTLVLLHLMFMVAGGASPTPASVLAALRAEGVLSSNGSGLIGRDAILKSFRHLTDAGFLRRAPQDHEKKGQFGAAGYELYRRPAYNPDWMPSAPLRPADGAVESPQVTPQTAMPGTVGRKRGRKRISAGQTVDGNAGHGNAVHGNAPHGGKHVSAGQTVDGNAGHGGGLVPHLQEEVTTSSPYPLTDTSGRGPAAPGEEEAVAFTADELTAASHLLQTLPQPWSQGRPKAKRLAPKLLEALADQGWPKILELSEADRPLLVRQLTKNPEKIGNHGSVLATDRIPNLPLYVTCRRPAVIRPRSEAPAPGTAGHCGDINCDPITRTRESRDEAGLLRLRHCPQCHPSAPRPGAG
uniref:hypothetical protein n=1 Tax=Kitasatospora indigofera TaxID=67307 RepID=UPI002F919BBF